MDPKFLLGIAFGIGVVAGLRSMTAPAAVAWMARLHSLNLQGSHLGFMGSTPAVILFTLLAVAELVNDKLPKTPSRTTPIPFAGRIVMGGLSAATLCAGGGGSAMAGGIAGALGAVAGTLGGYQARTRIVKQLHTKDLPVALAEDVLAVGAALLLASRVGA